MQLTDDVKSAWLNVIRRLQSISAQQKGYAIVTIQVLIDGNGNPILWTEPSMVKIEPQVGSSKFLAQLINGLKV